MGTLSYSYGKPYGYKDEPDTCIWCGEKLIDGGYRNNTWFCTLRCGYQWAVRVREMTDAALAASHKEET